MMTKMESKSIGGILELINEIQDDSTVPRNIKEKLAVCCNALNGESEVSIRIDKVRAILEEVSEDVNLDTFTRTQIWSISSMLERI